MSSATLVPPESKATGNTDRTAISTHRAVRRSQVLPYRAQLPAQFQRTPAQWKNTVVVSAVLAAVVVTAVAAAVAAH